jgi:hypothetical protein
MKRGVKSISEHFYAKIYPKKRRKKNNQMHNVLLCDIINFHTIAQLYAYDKRHLCTCIQYCFHSELIVQYRSVCEYFYTSIIVKRMLFCYIYVYFTLRVLVSYFSKQIKKNKNLDTEFSIDN